MTITLYNFVYKPRSELLIINHNKFVINDVVYAGKSVLLPESIASHEDTS